MQLLYMRKKVTQDDMDLFSALYELVLVFMNVFSVVHEFEIQDRPQKYMPLPENMTGLTRPF